MTTNSRKYHRSHLMDVGALPPDHFDLVVFDADDTLRRTKSGRLYPVETGDWELLPNVKKVLASLPKDTRFATASNQSGVHKKLLSYDRARSLLTACAEAAFPEKAPRLILFCPHTSAGGCECRKPCPGMLLEAATGFDVEPVRCLFVGDMHTDRQAADNAGFWFAWADDYFGWPRGLRPTS